MTQSKKPRTDEPRSRAPRANVLLNATVEQFGTAVVSQHRVRDLSEGGVRIDQAHLLRQGATVLVTVGALQGIGATVVWIADGWAGLRFATTIDPDQARARTAIAPRAGSVSAQQKPTIATRPAKAGWAADMSDAYRR